MEKPRINLKPKDLMEMYGVSRSTIGRWIIKGLPCKRFGNQIVRFDADRVTNWLERYHKEQH